MTDRIYTLNIFSVTRHNRPLELVEDMHVGRPNSTESGLEVVSTKKAVLSLTVAVKMTCTVNGCTHVSQDSPTQLHLHSVTFLVSSRHMYTHAYAKLDFRFIRPVSSLCQNDLCVPKSNPIGFPVHSPGFFSVPK